MTNIQRSLLHYLTSISALKRGNFRLASGRISDIYFDGRLAALESNCISLICEAFAPLLLPFDYDSIGAVEGVGSCVILGGLLNYVGDSQGFVIRKAPKEHGTMKMVEGIMGAKPVLIDDVATSGASLVHAVKHMPIPPRIACVLLDRHEGAAEALKPYNVDLISVLTMREIRDFKCDI